ncbi:DNA-directed RNA polymerase III subunit RPC10 [Diplonema papillatum]|nr:DNA-directed RNA polymerase III subunit RPC10 [Diplonema papillatum]
MLFCPQCATLLLLELEDGLRFFCTVCSYKCRMTEEVVVRTATKRKVAESALGPSAFKHALKKEIRCTSGRCESTRAFFFEVQTRTVGEPKTTFYKCVTCGNRWREH